MRARSRIPAPPDQPNGRSELPTTHMLKYWEFAP